MQTGSPSYACWISKRQLGINILVSFTKGPLTVFVDIFESPSYRSMKKLLPLVIAVCSFTAVISQYQIDFTPRISPDKAVYEKIGYTGIEIEYGSPSVKGRTIWGDVVQYEKVWRTGANDATVITFSEDVEINGSFLPKGSYAFFILPLKDEKWDLIFSSRYDQWGAFAHDKADEVLRVQVTPALNTFTEQLTFRIESSSFEKGKVYLEWENLSISFGVKTRYLDRLSTELEDKTVEQPDMAWIAFLQAAQFLLNENQHIELAKEWIDIAENAPKATKNWHPQYYPKIYLVGHLYWTKAKILAKMQRYGDALDYVEHLINLKGDYSYYNSERSNERIDEKTAEWQSKVK